MLFLFPGTVFFIRRAEPLTTTIFSFREKEAISRNTCLSKTLRCGSGPDKTIRTIFSDAAVGFCEPARALRGPINEA